MKHGSLPDLVRVRRSKVVPALPALLFSSVAAYALESWEQTTQADFDAGVINLTVTSDAAGGEVLLKVDCRYKGENPVLDVGAGGTWDDARVLGPSVLKDGDTFETSVGDWIRLADVDCPESYEYGYSEATDTLRELIYNKRVYLDVDDISVTDPYGRYVCLVYADYSATHYINVNKALLVRGVAVVDDYYNNEFSPYEWTLYIPKLQRANTMKLLTYSLGIGLITTIIIYMITRKVWNSITAFVRKHGQ